MIRFVSQGGPNELPPDVRLVRSFVRYEEALAFGRTITLTSDQETAVVYRTSYDGKQVYSSRQLDPKNVGTERHAGEPAGDPIGFDVFITPKSLLSPDPIAQPEYALVAAIQSIYAFSQQPRPGKGGP